MLIVSGHKPTTEYIHTINLWPSFMIRGDGGDENVYTFMNFGFAFLWPIRYLK